MGFRLELPEATDAGAGEGAGGRESRRPQRGQTLPVRYFLLEPDDPSLVLEAGDLWRGSGPERAARPSGFDTPRRHLVDAALLAGILRLDATAVMRDGDLLGRVLDTFVASQVRAELAVSETRPRLYHLRQQQGRHEIDVLGELAGRQVVGIEVKAAAAPSRDHARHLRWLRDELGERFAAGVLLHTGPRVYVLDERIVAAPICTLWA